MSIVAEVGEDSDAAGSGTRLVIGSAERTFAATDYRWLCRWDTPNSLQRGFYGSRSDAFNEVGSTFSSDVAPFSGDVAVEARQ